VIKLVAMGANSTQQRAKCMETGGTMRPQLFPALLTAAIAIYLTMSGPLAARWVNPDTSGYCASGTCSRFGGIRAANIKSCKPEHCRDYTAVSLKTVVPAKKLVCAEVLAGPWLWFWPRRDCGAANDK
jgi:hypothetical protein